MLKETRPRLLRKSPFWSKLFGDFLKFLPFLDVFLGPLQYLIFFIDPFTESNNLSKAGFDGIQSVNLHSG